MKNKNHPFHLIDKSPWPIFGSIAMFLNFSALIKSFSYNNNNLMILSLIMSSLVMWQWWRDIIRESTFQGHHTIMVTTGLRWGMILFIISEIFFFLSFFWSFFHNSLSPNIEFGMNWPPYNIKPFNPLEIPLLNTIILLTSGITITWTHHSIMENNFKQSYTSLFLTIKLGLIFSLMQYYEYKQASFSISDSVYGSSFFMATGFHGLHVIIGSSFLLVCFFRLINMQFSKIHHFGFEAAAWYWHFVDMVWLFLYLSIYWWGS
nr:cytochrome c oxidase subunit 3 [Aspidomorpha difformis]